MAADSGNLFDHVMAAATADPDRTLFRRPDGSSVTYRRMDERSAQFANALGALGAGPGDRLVVQVDKSTDAIALWLGCLRSGVVFVPLNTAYTDAEVDAFVDDADTGFVVTTPGRDRGATLGSDGSGTFAALADEQSTQAAVWAAGPGDSAAMLFTSGTTGRSKGAVLTHRGLLANAEALAQVWRITEEDRLLHTLPVFHVHGLFVAIHPLMLERASILFLPRFTVDDVIAHLPETTVLMGVPTHYTRLLDDPRFTPDLVTNVRLFTSGSAPMTGQVHARFTERTARSITERYGMTECGIITSNDPDNPRPGTVGRPLPGVELRVAAEGLVEVRGPHVLDQYWRRPDATADAFTADGWFRTGDVGTLDTDGTLTLVGRSSDLIISGGYNIYPKEVEQVLDDDPRIVESAVVGWPDDEWGETVVAFVVLEPGVTEFEPPALDGRLARFKQPRRWEIVESLPRNAMGKVQKSILRGR